MLQQICIGFTFFAFAQNHGPCNFGQRHVSTKIAAISWLQSHFTQSQSKIGQNAIRIVICRAKFFGAFLCTLPINTTFSRKNGTNRGQLPCRSRAVTIICTQLTDFHISYTICEKIARIKCDFISSKSTKIYNLYGHIAISVYLILVQCALFYTVIRYFDKKGRQL